MAAPAEKVGTEDEGDEPAVSLAELEQAMALYRGPVRDYDVVAITNAKVYTVSGETLDNGTVLIKDGRIAAVGVDARIPIVPPED